MPSDPESSLRSLATSISLFRKQRFLLGMSEDDFRDRVVRPLFLRKGLRDGRDLCGPQEKGKDCIFLSEDPLGATQLYAVQTKKGNLNLSSKASINLIAAETQLQTALKTHVPLISDRRKLFPAQAVLCASGVINESAREHVVANCTDPRIRFYDANDLIPQIDVIYPELWLDIDADRLPYLRRLREQLLNEPEGLALKELLPQLSVCSAVSDDIFVPLYLYRIDFVPKKSHGKFTREPKFVQFPVSALLRRNEKMVLILGEAGAGKTVCLRRLAYLIADRGLQAPATSEIPILLRAIDIAGDPRELLDVSTSFTQRVSNSSSSSLTLEDLKRGRFRLFIDGLDEIVSESVRNDLLTKVGRFHTSYPLCQVVISSRDSGFLRTLPQLAEYARFRISPIDWKQARQIVARLQKQQELPEHTVQEIVRRLQNVHGINLNPMLVTVFVATCDHAQRDIPANITELFKKFTEIMLGRWDLSKGLAQQHHATIKDFLLKRLAFEMHQRGLRSLSLSECKNIFTKELHERGLPIKLNTLLEETIHRSGLFRVDDESLEFSHMLLQEFFAGRAIPSKEFLESVVTEDWWKRPIIFYFGEHPDDYGTLGSTITTIQGRGLPPEEVYAAATTIGLSLQACYLAKTENKVAGISWVMKTLSRAWSEQQAGRSGPEHPLLDFLSYYLFARDSVAISILRDKASDVDELLRTEDPSGRDRELREFWLIVGLIESGELELAEEQIRTFKPSDERLSLGLHLGCFIMTHLKVSSASDKRVSLRIVRQLAPRIQHLRGELLAEFKSELLEVQEGAVRALPQPAEDGHPGSDDR